MTAIGVERSGRWTPWLAAPGLLVGLVLTDLFPVWGTAVGGAALVGAVLALTLHGPRWLVWLLGGVVLGAVALWALALVNMLNPGTGSASGSGSAAGHP